MRSSYMCDLNPAGFPYLSLKKPGVLYSAVWLVQLLIGVAHVFVPESGLFL